MGKDQPGRYVPTAVIFWSVIIVIVLGSHGAPAQQFAHSASYNRTLWQAADGLPEDTVQSLVETSDGALWIGTTGGLAKSGGGRIRTPIATPSVTSIVSTTDNTLWVGTDGGGLLHLVQRTAKVYTTQQGLTNGFVRRVYQDSHQQIWVGTDRGLFQVKGDRIEPVRFSGENPDLAVHAIFETRDGRLWFGGSKLISLDSAGRIEQHALSESMKAPSVNSMLQTVDGTLWLGLSNGLAALVDGKPKWLGPLSAPVRAVLQSKDGTLWVGTAGDGLWRYRSGIFARVQDPAMLPSSSVLALVQDQFDQMWIGTGAGLVRLEQSPLGLVELPATIDSGSGTVTGDRDGTVWVASNHVYVIRGDKARIVDLGLGKTAVKELYIGRDGAFWAGTESDGAYRVLHGRVEHFVTPQLASNSVRGFLESHEGKIWVATDSGLCVLNGKRWTTLREADGLAYNSTRALVQDREGNIWIGTDRGLSLSVDGHFVQSAATRALAEEKIWSILQDRQGALWFGTREHGLFRYQGGSLLHFSTAQGLPTNGIYNILQDRNGIFWVSGPNIIYSLQEAELETPSASQAPLNPVLYAIPSNGVQMYGGQQPAGFLAPDGTVWFPSNRGVAHISITKVNSSARAPQIYQISDQGYMQTLESSMKFPAAVGRVSYRLVAMYLRPQNALRFRYKLEGTDNSWSQVKPDEQVTYTNLKPGHHRLRVQAIDFATPGAFSEVNVDIYRAPHLYQTWWFYVLCFCAFALTIWLFYSFRLRQVSSRFRAVLEERNRLAREMHDTVIQGCTGMSVLIEAIQNAEPHPDERNQLLTYAKELASTTVHQAREAVWTMRHTPDVIIDLASALDTIAMQTMRDHAAIQVEFLQNGAMYFPSSMTHEVIMTVREAVHNAVQHSGTMRITLRAALTGDMLSVEVEDYGSGLPSFGDSGTSQGHYGIIGMQERIDRIGGTFKMKSKDSGGVLIRMAVSRSKSFHAKSGID